MIRGFEYIDRSHKGKPGIIYLREENSEKKIICQDFINKATGTFTKDQLEKLFKTEYGKLPVNAEIKTNAFKKKFRLKLRDKLVAKNKINEGTKNFTILCKKIQKFAEEIDSEV